MKHLTPQLKNRLKNVALLILVILMIGLTLLSWITDLSPQNIPVDSVLGNLYQRMLYGNNAFELRSSETPAAFPVRVAVSGEDGLQGAQYQSASVDALYSALEEDMGQAIDACGEFTECTEEAFQNALSGDTILFGYASPLPYRLLSAWIGSGAVNLSLKTDLLLLSGEGKLYLRGEAGDYYVATTVVNVEEWKNLADRPSASYCTYAGQMSEPQYAHLLPDTLIFRSDIQTVNDYKVVTPGFHEENNGNRIAQLLTAFSYEPYVDAYEENDGQTKVYVDNNSTLHVTNDGAVTFRATTLEGGLPAYEQGSVAESRRLLYCTDLARSLLENISGETQTQLCAVYENEENTSLVFMQMIDGIPVAAANGEAFAQFEFHENLLVGASVNLCGYEASGTKTTLIPSSVAAAAIVEEQQVGLAQTYTVDENGYVKAGRYYWQFTE